MSLVDDQTACRLLIEECGKALNTTGPDTLLALVTGIPARARSWMIAWDYDGGGSGGGI